MSDADSLSDLNIAPAKLMPKSPSLAEHHRVLNMSAVHAGNTLATIKAHKVRMDHLEERVEEVEEVRDVLWELKGEVASQREFVKEHAKNVTSSLENQDELLATINQRLAVSGTNLEIKKAIVTGIIGLLTVVVTAYCGYTWGHTPPEMQEKAPTHQQREEINQKIKAFDPDNIMRQNRPQ